MKFNHKMHLLFFAASVLLSACGSGGGVSANSADVSLRQVEITPANPIVVKGTSLQYAATGISPDDSTKDITTLVKWSSSNPEIATIDSSGMANATAAGTTTIIATAGTTTASATLTVTAAMLQTISITPADPTISAGTTQQFTAAGTYSDDSTRDLTTVVVWNSSNSGVATITNAADSKGLATAVTAGSTDISAAWGGVSGTASLTVTTTVTTPAFVTLSWDAPTSYSDGTPLNPATDLATYKIYYGTASGVYTHVISIPNSAAATSTTLTLTHGTYYFVISDVDRAGQESDYSTEAIKTI